MRPLHSLVCATLLVFAPTAAHAWNPTGHRVISEIAYRRLDEGTRRRVAEVLRNHPAADRLWANRPSNGPDEALNLFMNASLFPDDARRPPFDTYNRPKEHYVNYRILADQGNRVEPPIPDDNVLDSYTDNLRKIRDPATSSKDRALSLSWIFHQEGDIHQPLHAVARFSKALPQGDRGGNAVKIPNPRGRTDRDDNLHAYWDNLLGTDEEPATVDRLADEITAEFPVSVFDEDRRHTDIRQWAEESVRFSLQTVYRDLDPNQVRIAALPRGYEDAARPVARRRIALAGYRLADELERLFGSPRP